MNTNEIKKAKEGVTLTKRQRAIIVGLILGDGHLETMNNGRTYRLKVEHSLEQEDYTKWLFSELRDLIPASKPYIKVRKSGQKSIGFTTYSHGTFRFYGKAFYPGGAAKRIPKMIKKLLTPLGVAVWFMDDGSRKSLRHSTYNIHTLGYSKKDLKVLQSALKDNFDIKTTLHSQKGKYWRIYIPSDSAEKFTDLIKGYVQPIQSMQHKLVTNCPKSNGGV